MNSKIIFSGALFFMMIITSIGCKKDPIVDPNEYELITTLRITLTQKISGAQSVFEFQDLDGEGGQPPSKFDQIILDKGTGYDCSLELLNESADPVDNITAEIVQEGEDHEIFLSATNSLVVFSDLSKDLNNLPIGLSSTWMTSDFSGNGTLTITLKHKPGTKASGDLVTKGDTDVSIDFTLVVQ
jgi:hypothetical protein